VRGVFTSDLPDIERKHSLKLALHPHVGDLIKYDYLRSDVGLKYSLSSRLELRGDVAAYFSHGLGDVGFFKQAGFGEFHFNAKYRLGESLWRGWDSAIGLGYSKPIGSPPVDVTDGLEHRAISFTFARPLHNRPDVRIFWGASADFISETTTPGRHDDNELRDSNSTLSGGFIVDRGRIHYTFEAKATTTRLLGDSSDEVYEIRPGIIWELGKPRADGSRSRWLLGLGLSTTFGPDGTEFGLGARLRMDINLKRLLRGKHRDASREANR
jgi:hypothetical protein